MTSNDVKNYALVAFYAVMTLSILIFTVNYAFVDWEAVAGDIDDSLAGFMESVHCEIEYQDFRYQGLCTDPEMVLQYAINLTQLGEDCDG